MNNTQPGHESIGRELEDKHYAAKALAEGLAWKILEYRRRKENPPEELVRAQIAAEQEAIELRGMWETYAS